MNRTRIIGIDPGLVHTGVVEFDFVPARKQVILATIVVPGNDARMTGHSVLPIKAGEQGAVFIEAYRPRSHFDTDARMTALVGAVRRAIPRSQVIDNTGVKKVITSDILKALHVWNFSTKTHHQDLRSAALIGLYGMVKNEVFNEVLATFVRDLLDGNQWKVGKV